MIRMIQGKTPRIAASAYVVGDVDIDEGANVWPGAVIRGDLGRIIIGRDTAVEDNCLIHSGSPTHSFGDVTIGDKVIFGHGAVVNGRKIGSHVLIGMNATILHDVEIGDFCIIAGGCLVAEGMRIPDGSFVAGVPGKILGKASAQQLWWIDKGPQRYGELIEEYCRIWRMALPGSNQGSSSPPFHLQHPKDPPQIFPLRP